MAIVFGSVPLAVAHCGSGFVAEAMPPSDGGSGVEAIAPAAAEDASMLIVIHGTPLDASARTDTLDALSATDGAAPFDAPDGSRRAGCDASQGPMVTPCVLADEYGVFVASPESGRPPDGGATPLAEGAVAPDAAADAGDVGTMLHPAASIAQGVAVAAASQKKRLFVCNGFYPEPVTLSVPLDLYGGLSCAFDPASGRRLWAYEGGQAKVAPPSSSIALSLPGSSTPMRIEDFSFASSDSSAAPGGSSVAAWIVSSTVSFRRVTLRAGRGNDGAPGDDGARDPNYDPAAPVAPVGLAPGLDDVTAPFGGLPGAMNVCVHLGVSVGGNGGSGCGDEGVGASGAATPSPATSPGHDGRGQGVGRTDGGSGVDPNNDPFADTADPGADGLPGASSVPALSYGSLSPRGWTACRGGDGSPGNPGQGGGGGMDDHHGPGGCAAPFSDHAGGSGGAGGCGGSPGGGGQGGGGSIAIVAQASTIDLQQCLLITGAGGAGGPGGAGQDGQGGGSGTAQPGPYAAGHPGASGGNGAGGSGGAGGVGGVSVGIAYDLSTQLTYDAFTSSNIALGIPGPGGAPGASGAHGSGVLSRGNDGAPGARGMAGVTTFALGPL